MCRRKASQALGLTPCCTRLICPASATHTHVLPQTGYFPALTMPQSGTIVYQGDTSAAVAVFARHGYPCPPLTNPADHLMDVITPHVHADARGPPQAPLDCKLQEPPVIECDCRGRGKGSRAGRAQGQRMQARLSTQQCGCCSAPTLPLTRPSLQPARRRQPAGAGQPGSHAVEAPVQHSAAVSAASRALRGPVEWGLWSA
jgi:hypothetical protein